MAFRLIIFWLVSAAICSAAALFWARAQPRNLGVRIAVAAVMLIACASSFWMFGDHLDKTLGAVIGYFLLWGSVFAISAACAGIVAGTLIALSLGWTTAAPSPKR
jgi:hypothetical protein